ncbi:MAG: CHASE domain-containing protein, partial [Betaproteobacteria bacterium]|nr:CHASE domain-containing protein [Betaproteobacteria bacterium]
MNIRLRLPGIFRRTSTSILVLVLGLVVSALAAALVARQVEREAQLRFEGQVDDARLAIESRIDAYADVLGGVYALMNAAEPVSRGQFKRYVESLDVPRHYPGIAAISVSRRITAAQKPSFEARVRGDTSVDPGGYPGFAVKPPGERAEYVVLEYIEPTRGNEGALGLDIAGDPVRLAALEYARDTGRITATGIIKLALDPQQRQGFAMRLAYYRKGASLATVAQRREAFAGVVSVVFVAADLMRGVLREPFLRNMHVRIHDAGLID